MSVPRWLTFPTTVDETSARLVAAGVVAQGALFLGLQSGWVLVPLVYGFLARVAHGPVFSPLAQLVTRVITPRLHVEPRPVAGPPKRFAQSIGLLFSSTALVLWLAGADTAALVTIGMLVVAASLESFLGICLGCIAFARLMAWGVLPESACEDCNDLSSRLAAAASSR